MMPSGWEFLALALAAWRLARFLMFEAGPWNLTRKLRERIGIEHYPGTADPASYPDTMLGGLFGCMWCLSTWTAAAVLGVWLTGYGVALVLIGGIAGAAVVIDTLVGRLRNDGPS